MTVDLNALEALARAATLGPWVLQANENGEMVEIVNNDDFIGDTTGRSKGVDAEADAAFIAASDPPTVLVLIDRVRRQDAELRAAREERDQFAEQAALRPTEYRELQQALSAAYAKIANLKGGDATEKEPLGTGLSIKPDQGPDADSASVSKVLFPIAPDARRGKAPCGECHLNFGETCDICGASKLMTSQEEAWRKWRSKNYEDECGDITEIEEAFAAGFAARGGVDA